MSVQGLRGVAALCVDCADPPALAAWWQRLVGGRVQVDDDGDALLTAPGLPPVDFLRVPGPKTVKNRLHLDVYADDPAATADRLVELGATRAPDVYDGGDWVVLRDPEGNELCLLPAP
jgi:hypothetical protein